MPLTESISSMNELGCLAGVRDGIQFLSITNNERKLNVCQVYIYLVLTLYFEFSFLRKKKRIKQPNIAHPIKNVFILFG
jgi:hypothetical protein